MNVLAFFAHPDDETMLCGGTLALLAEQGAAVHVLIATRGEGGELGEPPTCTRETLGEVREAELRCAVKALGGSQLTLLDYSDPLVGPEDALFAFTEDLDQLSSELSQVLSAASIDVVLAHGVNGEYGHPAHKIVHQAARQAIARLGAGAPLFYTVQGAFEGHPYPRLMNTDAPAHLILDVTPMLERKTAAAMCHRTQHALFVRRRSEEAGRKLEVPEVIMAQESVTHVWPPMNGSAPDDRFSQALLSSGWARRP